MKKLLELAIYIEKLKLRVLYLQNNLPEFWQHEDLRELKVLQEIIKKLERINEMD